jgi:transposase
MTFFMFKLEKLLTKKYGDKKIYIIMDNCVIHKSKFFHKMIKYLRINILYLPPYSPEFMPIELFFNSMKIDLK